MTDRDYELRRHYGITEEDLKTVLDTCQGMCPICDREWDWNEKKLSKPVIDHDHKTGELRGIICGYCNIAEGYLSSHGAAINLAHYIRQSEEVSGLFTY